jgi:hypothetical protein
MSEVTRILNAIDQGDPYAAAQLLPLVYEAAEAMRRILVEQARRKKTEKHGGTLRQAG